MSVTPERLAWLREQLTGRIAEEPLAGEIFRPRGAWGDRPARFRRLAFRRLGLGEGFHRLERGMGLLNLAVATPSRLHLFSLRGARGGMSVASEIATWPLAGLELTSERRTVEARHRAAAGGDTFSTTSYKSRIVVLRIEPPGEPQLEIDLAGGRDASALLEALRAAAVANVGL